MQNTYSEFPASNLVFIRLVYPRPIEEEGEFVPWADDPILQEIPHHSLGALISWSLCGVVLNAKKRKHPVDLR